MRFIEESIILVSVSWMIIYLYGLFQLSSAAYHHWLWLIPGILSVILIVSLYKKISKGGGS